MDDSCAVCADNLEWVAYGACGHRDVCSTCVVRLRFICQDRRCCICKTESDDVFVTKAMGDYTRMINDFSLLPSEPKEGKIGSYWYHEDTHAFFDDADHYKMIKAMCRLSCSECDNIEEETNDVAKRRAKYRNIEQLKGHLFHVHKLVMCSLCLEGRKVFICEQKLFTRSQLSQHVNTGDSEVDGSESERGGFMGHPICEFCRTPFYGDNELYTHMSRDHYTCHICQRQHPGQYEYYKNYDDLEKHFGRDHFLCEDESCLAKKFVVFQSEAEMKRHNTIEHAGRMSRSKRNAALQIPTSFQFHREQDPRTRRGRGSGRGLAFRDDYPDDQLSMAIQASLESSGTQISGHGDGNDIDPVTRPLESLALTESTPPRYLEATGNSSSAVLQESAFPPLPVVPKSTQQKKRKNKKASASRSAQEWPASRASSSSSWSQWPAINTVTSSSQNTFSAPPGSMNASPSPVVPISVPGYASARPPGNLGGTSQTRNPVSASSLTVNRLSRPSNSDFPPVSAMQVRRTPLSVQVVPNDVQNANKSLVDKVRDALDQDEAKYASFKEISGQYRQGTIDSEMYLARVRIFGLSHLVLELARLCPDPAKQQELVDTYNASLGSKGQNGKGAGKAAIKGKGIASEGSSSSRDRLADNIINTVRTMQPRYRPAEDEVEVLSKDGYRKHSKGKSSLVADQQQSSELPGRHDLISQIARDAALAGGGSKQKKKISKFQRVRLGDGSMSAMLDTRNSEPDPDPGLVMGVGSSSNGVLPVRGVWRKGGGKKLFA